jgi:hypothetical protein
LIKIACLTNRRAFGEIIRMGKRSPHEASAEESRPQSAILQGTHHGFGDLPNPFPNPVLRLMGTLDCPAVHVQTEDFAAPPIPSNWLSTKGTNLA